MIRPPAEAGCVEGRGHGKLNWLAKGFGSAVGHGTFARVYLSRVARGEQA